MGPNRRAQERARAAAEAAAKAKRAEAERKAIAELTLPVGVEDGIVTMRYPRAQPTFAAYHEHLSHDLR